MRAGLTERLRSSALPMATDPPPTADLGVLLAVQCCDRPVDHAFVHEALRLIDADRRRSVDTALLSLSLRGVPGIELYLKDEAAHATGSLKHRLARALFIFGLINGQLRRGRPLVEASSGSTAVSEAFFARMLGLPFHAVMPTTTSPAKLAAIEAEGGVCHLVAASEMYAEAQELATRLDGVYLDQFTFAERVTDWRRNNVASALLSQMESERCPVPDWIVVGLGTGGTATTIGRHLRLRGLSTRLCAADVERSAFYGGYRDNTRTARCSDPSRIEGVGRPRVEPSFVPEVVDRMMKVPDAVSMAGMRILSDLLGRSVGASTGLNFVVTALIAREMAAAGVKGSIATLICDRGDRYVTTCHNNEWLRAHGLLDDVIVAEATLRSALL